MALLGRLLFEVVSIELGHSERTKCDADFMVDHELGQLDTVISLD